MSLLEELKNKRGAVAGVRQLNDEKIEALNAHNAICDASLADLDRAIAALSVPEVAEVEIPEWFTRHDGSQRPVDPDAKVVVIFRDGTESSSTQADWWGWHHVGVIEDIIAYRVLPIEPAAEAKGEEEPEEAECAPPTEGLIEKMERLIRERDAAEDPTAVAIAAYIEAEQADYPDLTDEQDAAIESATAEYQSTDGAEIVSGEPWSISASEQHAEESALAQSLPPLFKSEPPQAATPEELMESGAINGEAYWLSRKLAKVEA